MELKKAPQADVEKERTTFFLLGFTVVLSTLFVLLEWSAEDDLPPLWEGLSPIVFENEYQYNEPPASLPVEPGIKPELPVINRPVVYEGYHLVEDVPDEIVAESIPETAAAMHLPDDPASRLSDHKPADIEQAVVSADVMPQYPGGYAAMNRYLFNQLKYPASALSQRIEGRVWCSFIVNKDGSLADIQVEKSVHASLDQEAMRALQAMPAWSPGTVKGNPVRVKVYLPIIFKL